MEWLSDALHPFNEWVKQNWEDISSLVGISTLAAACRTILSPTQRTFLALCRATILAVFTSIIVGAMIWDYSGVTKSFKFGIIGLSGLLADYILLGCISFATYVSENPKKAIPAIVNFILRRQPEKENG